MIFQHFDKYSAIITVFKKFNAAVSDKFIAFITAPTPFTQTDYFGNGIILHVYIADSLCCCLNRGYKAIINPDTADEEEIINFL